MDKSIIYTFIGVAVYLGAIIWVSMFFLTRPYSAQKNIKSQTRSRMIFATILAFIISFIIYGLLYTSALPYTGERYYMRDNEICDDGYYPTH